AQGHGAHAQRGRRGVRRDGLQAPRRGPELRLAYRPDRGDGRAGCGEHPLPQRDRPGRGPGGGTPAADRGVRGRARQPVPGRGARLCGRGDPAVGHPGAGGAGPAGVAGQAGHAPPEEARQHPAVAGQPPVNSARAGPNSSVTAYASAARFTRPKKPTQNRPGSQVRRANWSASESRAPRRHRSRCNSATGRTAPSSRNHTNTYANAACTSGPAYQDTANRAPPATSTDSNPYRLRIISSTASSSARLAHSNSVIRPVTSSQAPPSPSSAGAG